MVYSQIKSNYEWKHLVLRNVRVTEGKLESAFISFVFSILLNPFLANVSILYPLKTYKNL